LSPGNSDSLPRRNCDLELEEDSKETFIDVSARAIPEENYVCGREDRRFNKGNENSQVSRRRQGRHVALREDALVVQRMADGDERLRQDSDGFAAGGAVAEPG